MRAVVMAKRGSKQDVGAKQDAPLFDYSEAEWSEIEAAARAVLPDDEPLPTEVREALVIHARYYRADINALPWAKWQRDWQRIMRLSEHLHQAVLLKIEQSEEHFLKRPATRHLWLEDPLRGILKIKNFAKEKAQPPKYSKKPNPARVSFQSYVLRTWIRLGGQLRFSRHPKTKRPQGPLIRFFRAVTTPVMGASAPSLESIPDIIQREKRVRALQAAAALQKANGDSR